MRYPDSALKTASSDPLGTARMLVAFLVLGCGSSTEPNTTPSARSLTFTSDSVISYPGKAVGLPTVKLFDADHRQIQGEVTWSSQDSSIATVSGSHVVGNEEGTTSLTARSVSGSASGTVSVRVIREPVAAFASNLGGFLVIGDSLQSRVYPVGPLGDSLEGRSFSLSSLTPEIATLSPAGIIHARSIGFAHFLATSEGVAETISLQVTAGLSHITVSPDSMQLVVGTESPPFVVRVFDEAGNEECCVRIRFTSTDSLVAYADPYDEAVVANKVGTAYVVATVGTLSAAIHVTVVPAP